MKIRLKKYNPEKRVDLLKNSNFQIYTQYFMK